MAIRVAEYRSGRSVRLPSRTFERQRLRPAAPCSSGIMRLIRRRPRRLEDARGTTSSAAAHGRSAYPSRIRRDWRSVSTTISCDRSTRARLARSPWPDPRGLAERIGTTDSTLSSIENGSSKGASSCSAGLRGYSTYRLTSWSDGGTTISFIPAAGIPAGRTLMRRDEVARQPSSYLLPRLHRRHKAKTRIF